MQHKAQQERDVLREELRRAAAREDGVREQLRVAAATQCEQLLQLVVVPGIVVRALDGQHRVLDRRLIGALPHLDAEDPDRRIQDLDLLDC